MINLSVVMPTMNEEGAIQKVIEDIKKNTGLYDTEIIIADSSTDNTPSIAEGMGVRVIKVPAEGPGNALIEGLKQSNGEIVITADCDDTYPMDSINLFINKWQEGFDFVNGSRMKHLQGSMPIVNQFGNWFFAFLIKNLYSVPVKDVATGMRLFTRDLIDSNNWEMNYSFWIEVLIKAQKNGYRIAEIDIDYRPRIGETKLNRMRSGLSFLKCIMKYL